jgi:GDP-L-fucose synthase
MSQVSPELSASFRGAKVVVTGGTGMIGRQIVTQLCDMGAKVTTLSLDQLQADPRAPHVYGDLSSPEFCREQTKGADFVVHAAGIKGSVEVTKSRPASFFVPLVLMNTNVLEACRVNGVKKVVYTSSIGAYAPGEIFKEENDSFDQQPMDMYPGWAKRMAELQVQAYRIQYGAQNFAIVRPCNVYGPGDNFDPANAMVVPSLMARLRGGENPLVVWGDGSAVRDIAYSKDVATGCIQALYHGTGDGFVNLGSGTGVSIRQLVEALQKVVPFEFKFDTTKSGGFPRRVMDISKARKLIGYEPSTSLEAGLRETWEWYLANHAEHEKKVNFFR